MGIFSKNQNTDDAIAAKLLSAIETLTAKIGGAGTDGEQTPAPVAPPPTAAKAATPPATEPTTEPITKKDGKNNGEPPPEPEAREADSPAATDGNGGAPEIKGQEGGAGKADTRESGQPPDGGATAPELPPEPEANPNPPASLIDGETDAKDEIIKGLTARVLAAEKELKAKDEEIESILRKMDEDFGDIEPAGGKKDPPPINDSDDTEDLRALFRAAQ
jgi:hypothetical protein